MKTINKYLCAIAFLLGLFSCDSFLTTPPLDQISEDQWWNDKSQTEMMVKVLLGEDPATEINRVRQRAFGDAYDEIGRAHV